MPANLEDARRLLGDGALFRKLAPNDRDSLVARAHIRSFGAGDTIFRMGDLHDSMIAILDGEVRIASLPQTARSSYSQLFTQGTYSAKLQCSTGSRAAPMPRH